MKGCESCGLGVGKAWRPVAWPRPRALHQIFGYFLAAALLSLSTGCGLVAYPQRTQLPPAGYCSVYVRDATSHELLTNATVRFEAVKGKNWMKGPGSLRASQGSVIDDTRRPKVELPGQPVAPGHHVFQPIHKTEWAHVVFPVGLPLGGVMYHFYEGSLVAECPGHVPVRVRGDTAKLFPVYKNANQNLVTFDGQLTIFLPPKTP